MNDLVVLNYNYEPLTLTLLGDPAECMTGEMMELAKHLRSLVEDISNAIMPVA